MDVSGGGRKEKTMLTTIEEKLAFPISRWFWHFIVGIGVLVFVGSFLVLLYSFTPIIKKNIVRESYPPKVEVNSSEITSCRSKSSEQEKQYEAPSTGHIYVSFAELEALIPPKTYEWRALGHYEDSYYYQSTWVMTDEGIISPLQKYLDGVAMNDTNGQKLAIEGLSGIIKGFQEKNRKRVLQKSLGWLNSKPEQNAAIIEALQKAAGHLVEMNNSLLFCKIAEFGKANPKDGVLFVNMYNLIMSAQNAEHYDALFGLVKSAFQYSFKEDVQTMTDATEKYIKLPSTERVEPISALACFYNVYISKFNDRMEQVQKIDTKYNEAKATVETKAVSEKIAKKTIRTTALLVFGSAICGVAFFSLMLVLLSIQRTLKQLVELTKGSR